MKYVYTATSVAVRWAFIAVALMQWRPWLLLVPVLYGALGRRQVSLLNCWLLGIPLWIDSRASAVEWSGAGCLAVVSMLAARRRRDPTAPAKLLVGPFWVAYHVPAYLVDLVTTLIVLPPFLVQALRWRTIRSEVPNAFLALAAGSYRRDRHDLSLRLLGPTFALAAWAPNPKATGQAHHLHGLILEARGDWDGAVASLKRAKKALSGPGQEESEALDRVRGDLGRLVGGRLGETLVPNRREDSRVTVHQMLRDAMDLACTGDLEGALDLTRRAEWAARNHHDHDGLLTKRAQAQAITLGLESGQISPARAASDLGEIARYFDRMHDAENALATRIDQADALHRAGDTRTAVGNLQLLAERAKRRGMHQGFVVSRSIEAIIHEEARPDEALRCLVDAIAVIDHTRYMRSSTVARLSLALETRDFYGMALRLALRLGQLPLMVELMESSRLQAQPLPAAADGAAEILDLMMGTPTFVTVGGESRLAVSMQSIAETSKSFVALERVLSAVDPDAWWWSSWYRNDEYYWALVTADGVRAAGGGRPDESFEGALGEIMASSSGRGPLAESCLAEEVVTGIISAVILPEPLRAVLLERAEDQRAGRGRPLRLLTAMAPLLSHVPVALLPLTTDQRAPRLVEGAIVQAVPPASLLAELVERDRAHAPGELGLAVVDPVGNLPSSSNPPFGIWHVLSGRGSGDTFATRANVLKALSSSARPGVFYYAGHFSLGEGTLSSGIELADGILSARDLYLRAGTPFPARALLSGCSSLSSGSVGYVDFTGFVAAALHTGANGVVATTWDLLDSRFTTVVDHRIADVLAYGSDPAAGLRAVQLGCLAQWRSSRTPARAVIWAAYQYIGV